MITVVAVFAAIKGDLTSEAGTGHIIKTLIGIATLDFCTIILAGICL